MKVDYKNKSILFAHIIVFFIITIALTIIVKTPPTNGYEISIYEIYPWYFWFFIITSIIIGQIILANFALSIDNKNKLWVFGFVAIIMTNIILLFMPFIRGYAIYGRGDALTHVGYVKDIIRTGFLGTNNFYPLDHILAAKLSYLLAVNVEYIINIIPPIFSIFYIVSIYLFANHIFKRASEVLLTLAFTTILLFSNHNLFFAPYVQSFFVIPFIIYIYFKSRDLDNAFAYAIILIILLFFTVFFHPLSTLFLILVFLILEFSLVVYKRIQTDCQLKKISAHRVILILIVTFVLWYFSFSSILHSMKTVFNWLIHESGTTESKTYSDLISQVRPDFLDLIEVILNTYGQVIIIGFLSVIFSFYIYYVHVRSKEGERLELYHVFFSIGSLVFAFSSIVFFFNNFIVGFDRSLNYFLFFSSIFIPLCFSLVFTKYRYSSTQKLLSYLLLFSTLVLLVYFSIFNLYFSPITQSDNHQVSEMELTGMMWFFNYRNEEVLIQNIGISQKRFHDAIYGVAVPSKNIISGKDTGLIDHFGYINNYSLGDYYKNKRYILISTLIKLHYPKALPKYERLWKYTPDDFDMLEKDNTVIKVYNNGDLDVYIIN